MEYRIFLIFYICIFLYQTPSSNKIDINPNPEQEKNTCTPALSKFDPSFIRLGTLRKL